MMLFAKLCLLAGLGFLLATRVRTLLTYFQQEEYDGTRFLGAWQSVRLFDVKATAATVGVVALAALGGPHVLLLLLLAIVYAALAYFERTHRYKKALVSTERATRIYRLTLGVVGVLELLVLLHPLWAVLVLQVAPLVMAGVNRLLQPMQARINAGFETQARDKLERLDPVRIGITGSFGKTTVKHMLAEILIASGPVFYSPGSINTVLGHTRHIRQRLQWSHKYFIAEMGAYGIGSIKRLCDFAHPNYGIVTAVGDAHTERFGSIEAIAQAKSELAEEVCKAGGKVVINEALLQYAPFARMRQTHGDDVITVGFDAADVTINHTELTGGSWSISLVSKHAVLDGLTYELPLLGEHNVLNSALAVVLAITIDPTIADQIPFFTRTISQVPHRLQKVGAPGSALILDDAYNSNEMGFMSAVTAMSKLAEQRGGRRILVTPGIAELGLEHDRVHDRLGSFSAGHCDMIYVVNPSRIKSFVDAARSGQAEIIEVPTFSDARAAIAKELCREDVILYENDLPDLLEEQRLL